MLTQHGGIVLCRLFLSLSLSLSLLPPLGSATQERRKRVRKEQEGQGSYLPRGGSQKGKPTKARVMESRLGHIKLPTRKRSTTKVNKVNMVKIKSDFPWPLTVFKNIHICHNLMLNIIFMNVASIGHSGKLLWKTK